MDGAGRQRAMSLGSYSGGAGTGLNVNPNITGPASTLAPVTRLIDVSQAATLAVNRARDIDADAATATRTATRAAADANRAANIACDINTDITGYISSTADAAASAASAADASERAAVNGIRNTAADNARDEAIAASERAIACVTQKANTAAAAAEQRDTLLRNLGEANRKINELNPRLTETEAKNKNFRNILLIAIIVAIIITIALIVVGLTNREHFDNYFWWFIGTGIFLFLVIIIMIIIYFRNTAAITSVRNRLAAGGRGLGDAFVAGAGKIGPGFTIGNTPTEFDSWFRIIFGVIASILIGAGIALLFTGIRNNTAEFNTAAIGCLVGGVFTLLTILFAFNTRVIQKNFTQIILIHLVLIAAIILTLLGFAEDKVVVDGQEQNHTLWGFAGVGIGLFVLFLIGFTIFYITNRNSNFKSIFMQNFYNIFVIFLLAAAFTGGVSMLIITLTTSNNEHLAIPSAILLILGFIGAVIARKYIKFSIE